MTTSGNVLFTLLLVFSYLVAPITLVWGWAGWIKQRWRIWTVSSILSLIGFSFASISAIFALWVIAYASGGGFEHTPGISYYSPNYAFFYRCIRRGAVLSLLGFAFAIGGVWRRNPLRWQAPVGAVGTLSFWLLATTWP